MRATLHFSLLAATLSPSLVHSSPIPFTQNYNSSPRSSAQALSDSSRPGGVLSGRSPLTRGGSQSYGLGLFDLGSNNGGNGGDASSGSSYAQGGDYPGDEDDHPSGGGPQPAPVGSDGNAKPGVSDPGVTMPPSNEPKKDSGNKSADGSTPGKYTNSDNPAAASPKPGPDPGAGENTPDIPILLGPSNTEPSSGSGSPPSDVPQDSGYPDDEGRHKYNYDIPCGSPFGGPLVDLLSNNGGDGGDASLGHGDGSSSAYSGAGGIASGGSVYASPGLINVLSDNGGDGGKANSGDSYSVSKRRDSASYSGPGGNASGGSVKNPCSRRRAISRTLVDSGTSRNSLTRSRSGGSLLAMQRQRDDRTAAYSGMGGNASGGSVEDGRALINIGSGNGGDGGDASSGSAFAYGPGATAYSGAGGNASGGNVGRRALVDVRSGEKMFYHRLSPGKYDPAHQGASKYPASENGAEHHNHDSLVNVWSGNGGHGGDAQSGNAYAYGHGASAYTGPGGNASGGSVTSGKRDGADGRNSGASAYTGPGGNASGGSIEGGDGLINFFSSNGGDGGDASSGPAFAYGKDAKASSGHGGNASGGSVKDEKYEKPGYGHGRATEFR
ncbi:hypothetical protein BJV74DRAFT_880748 [Russula compacta]|nr:hypothetical protein BJV74DRAFT_880748 [Russula compacta]